MISGEKLSTPSSAASSWINVTPVVVCLCDSRHFSTSLHSFGRRQHKSGGNYLLRRGQRKGLYLSRHS
jgi:hypothetical protein